MSLGSEGWASVQVAYESFPLSPESCPRPCPSASAREASLAFRLWLASSPAQRLPSGVGVLLWVRLGNVNSWSLSERPELVRDQVFSVEFALKTELCFKDGNRF